MKSFRSMVNDCLRKGLASNASSMKNLSIQSYGELRRRTRGNSIPSYFCLTAISKAAGILGARKKSLRGGIETRNPHLGKPFLISCYYFRIKDKCLVFSVSKGKRTRIPLTNHTLESIKDLEVRSFTVSPTSLSLTFRKEVEHYVPKSFLGGRSKRRERHLRE